MCQNKILHAKALNAQRITNLILPVLFFAMILTVLPSITLLAMGSDILPGKLIVQRIPSGLPVVSTIEELEELSRYTLKGKITEIKPTTLLVKSVQSDNQTLSVDKISINIGDKIKNSHTDNNIKFLAFRYISKGSSGLDQPSHTFQIGEDVFVFLTGREPKSDFVNSYAGFVADKYTISEGVAYNVTSTKQDSPLKQLKSGIHSRYVNCNEGLELLIKVSNGQPICVKPDTKEKLIERGWAKPI